MSCSFDSLFRTLVLKRLRLSVFGLLALVCGGGIGVEAAPVLTSVKEIRSFSREPAGEELKVKFQGAVAARLRFRQLIFVVDGGEAVSVYAPGTNSAVNVGQRVEIEGMTVDTPGVHCLLEGLRKIGAPGPIPEPEEVSVKNLRESDDVLQWVKLSGVVQSVRFSRGRASGRAIVTIRDRGRAFPISARRLPGLELDDYRFAHVSATGKVPRVEGGVGGQHEQFQDREGGAQVSVQEAGSSDRGTHEDGGCQAVAEKRPARTRNRGKGSVGRRILGAGSDRTYSL